VCVARGTCMLIRAAASLPVLFFGLLLPISPSADQNDPGLDALFERIAVTDDPEEATVIQSKIWRIWVRAEQAEIDRLMEKGIEALATNELERAIDLFTEIVEKSPNFAEGWNKRATAYYLNGDFNASVRDIERTLALEPRHFGAVSGMGLIFLSQGDNVGALQAFTRVLEINPHAEGAREQVRRLNQALQGQGV